MLDLPFEASYARELEGLYLPWKGAAVPAPAILRLNHDLARDLGLDPAALATPEGAALLSGSQTAASSQPLAQAYAGQQFGGFSPQLGDGRALLLGEIIDTAGQRRDIHLKGSGRTPFSRGGDGKAALGPVLREYLMGEAMHALGIPTTRALAALTTGEEIAREQLQPGAILVRVAASHIRVGTFQFFAARGETERLRRLADYTIRRHFPELAGRDDRYLGLLDGVIERQAALVARWLAVGFVHGVMNTDNMTVSGETIDYGPCAFMERHDPQTVFSSIDTRGRYAYGNQPGILQWNLARFAETLLPLINPDDDEAAVRLATGVIHSIPARYKAHWLGQMRGKLGLDAEDAGDPALIDELLGLMATHAVDFTSAFRHLAAALRGDEAPARQLFGHAPAFAAWFARYRLRLGPQPEGAASAMDRVNPLYIPRNHLVEEALAVAVGQSDMARFDALLALVSQPFVAQAGMQAYEAPAPATAAPYVTFCGT